MPPRKKEIEKCHCHNEIKEKELTPKEKVMVSVKDLLKSKRTMPIDERRDKFGISADCDIMVVNRLVAIVVDNPLPDDDMAILVTNAEKVIDLALGGIGKRFVDEAKGVTFFEED